MVTSPASAVVELMDPTLPMLVIEPMLPCEPIVGGSPVGRSSTGLVTWLELDTEPLDVVLVSALGRRQQAYANRRVCIYS